MSRGPEVHGPWIPNQEALATSASRSWDLSGHFGAIITTPTPLEMTDFSTQAADCVSVVLDTLMYNYDSLKRNHLVYLLLLLLEKFSHMKCNLILSYLTNMVHILYFPPSVFAIYLQ